jgi:transposase
MFEPLVRSNPVSRKGGLSHRHPDRIIGDKAYSSQANRLLLRRLGIRITIPRKKNEKRSGPFDKECYRERNQVERLINRLKQNRRVATRYEKRGPNYLAMVMLASIRLWL